MSRSSIISLIAFLGAIVWVYTLNAARIDGIQSAARNLMSPFIHASGKVDEALSSDDADPGMAPKEMAGKLGELETEVMELRIVKQRYSQLLEENRDLRLKLNYLERESLDDRDTVKLVPARVVSRKPGTWYNTVVLDKGHEDQVAVDSPVVTDQGLVGKVVQVGDHECTVVLLSDEICQVSARVIGTTEEGILSGQRGSHRIMPELKLKYLSKDAQVNEGDTVWTSGAGEVFPPGLILGEIREFRNDGFTGEATVIPAVDFGTLKMVFIWLKLDKQ